MPLWSYDIFLPEIFLLTFLRDKGNDAGRDVFEHPDCNRIVNHYGCTPASCYLTEWSFIDEWSDNDETVQIDLPASTPWVSHSVREDDVAAKPLEHLINFLQGVKQRSIRWAIYIYTSRNCVHWGIICTRTETLETTLTYPPYSVVIQCGLGRTPKNWKQVLDLSS